MSRAILHLIRKEFIQVFRDRRVRMIIFIAPVVQLTLFGYAITTDIKEIQTAVCDLDRTGESRELIASLHASGYFNVLAQPRSPREIETLLRRSAVKFGLVIPRGFARSLKRADKIPLEILLDGSDSNTATFAMNYLNQILGERALRLVSDLQSRVVPDSGAVPRFGRVQPVARVWFNPGLLSAPYMVPGVMALILTLATLLLPAMGVARERETGTIEQLIVSPLTPLELVIGKTVPYVVIGFIDVVIILTAGHYLFSLPVRGSLVTLLGAVLIYLLTSVGSGLFISTFSRTQQQAMLTSMFVLMPAVILSGFFFPITSMPQWAQILTLANPLRYFIAVLRSVLIKGSGPAVIWPEATSLLVLGALIFSGSLARFRRRLG
jgi:ABC-2 type transport system permease protein